MTLASGAAPQRLAVAGEEHTLSPRATGSSFLRLATERCS